MATSRQSQSLLGIPVLAKKTCWAIQEEREQERGPCRRQGLNSNYVSRLCPSRAFLTDTLALSRQMLMTLGNCVQQAIVVTVDLGDDLVILAQAILIRVVCPESGKLALHWSSHLCRWPPSWFHQSCWPPWHAPCYPRSHHL